MNKIKLQILIAFFALTITNSVIAYETKTFTTAPTHFLVSQNQPPIQAESSFNGSLAYTQGLWTSGQVKSATFRVYLSDDLSDVFFPNFDAPVEFAQLVSVTDGSLSVTGLPVEVAVYPSSFGAIGAIPIGVATAAGIESPTVLPSNSGAFYFDLDVTELLNNSNTGALKFSLIAPDKFPNISKAANPVAHDLITRHIEATNLHQDHPNAPFEIIDPYWLTEDYIFEFAELTVIYGDSVAPANIPTLSEWSMILLMFSLAGLAAMRLRHY